MTSSPIGRNSSPAPSADDVLTPTRKVQALLAQFDDSDSEQTTPPPKANNIRNRGKESHGRPSKASATSEDEDQDSLPVARPSRMAARLQGNKQAAQSHSLGSESMKDAKEPLNQHEWRETGQGHHNVSSTSREISEDELTRPAPRRRLLLKRKRGSVAPSSPVEEPSRSLAPPLFSSPRAERDLPKSSPRATYRNSDSPTPSPAEGTGSKFMALIEKHRKARIEIEAAEIAKRAARRSEKDEDHRPRKQRGSSPADDSDEGSDDSNVGAARRLTKDAKPTRKASKKAVEEMKRETQRMSRNMQLAHQARTRKKVTKESLLARFNFSAPVLAAEAGPVGDQSATASSEIGSDVEASRHLETPPTSPLQGPFHQDKSILEHAQPQFDHLMTELNDHVVEPPSLEELGLEAPSDRDKGKGKSADWAPQKPLEAWTATAAVPLSQTEWKIDAGGRKPDMRSRIAEFLKSQRPEVNDEADDLDVITSKGDIRKYAVFERLPKRKAKETQSHLALRSLAHLHNNEGNNRSSMTLAEMETALKRAARMQARQERQQKLDELKAKGVVIQTAEERERDQQEVEDLVERARQEAAEISKREKEAAKKDGTFVKDDLDDDDDDDDDESGDEDFEDEAEQDMPEDSEAESEEGCEDEEVEAPADDDKELIDDQADEAESEEESGAGSEEALSDQSDKENVAYQTPAPRKSRTARVVIDDDDVPSEPAAVDSPAFQQPAKTPQSLPRSARKQIPGLDMSDDLPLGLTQAFAATMADSQSQPEELTQHQDSLSIIRDLPSPNIAMAPKLRRLDSLDMVSDSQPASQTQPLNINLSFSQSQKVPESPLLEREYPVTQPTPSQAPFEPTQDAGYAFSPFQGSRFALETPQAHAPHSTVDTVIPPNAIDASPILQRKGRLQRGRAHLIESDDEAEPERVMDKSAFEVMRRAAKKDQQPTFDKSKSNARDVVDEAAEESDDEYAGLGGASDDDVNDEENEADREMIDHDTQVGKGDEAKLAGLFADRERKNDEAAVSKLLKDITTGALRRKRGVNDDLDLSDEEDAVARRREAKRREFAKMRRELLKDEAVGKIAEDKKKEAFLRSIEDRELASDDDDFDQGETPLEDSQEQSLQQPVPEATDNPDTRAGEKRKRPLEASSDSQLNRLPPSLRFPGHNRKPATLAEIRESVSFLIEEPDSQAGRIDLDLSDSESEPEAYVNLDRHFKTAEADENAAFDEDEDDLDDFIVDDDEELQDQHKSASQDSVFKKPSLPSQSARAGFADRRTNRSNVVNRISLLRQSSSTSSSSTTTKLAFQPTASSSTPGFKVPSLLRRATTNSSFSSLSSSSENISATGVTTSRTERGHVSEEKEFIRKGTGGRRNAVNYRPTVKEEKMSARAGVQRAVQRGKAGKNGKSGASGGSGFLGGLFRTDSWG